MREQEREIRRLEYLARSCPRAWRCRVAFWVALGYGILALFPLSLATLIVTIALWALGHDGDLFSSLCLLALLAALGVSLSHFVVRLAPPAGIPLRYADAPALFDSVRELSRKLRVRPFTRILLTPESGAGVVELPRAWGGTISYLLVGLPLLEALSPEQARAVLAHELAHLCGGDSRFTRAIVRLSTIWERLYGQGGGRAFSRLASWYFPRLAVHTHAVRRNNERAADSRAAALCGSEVLAEALGATLGRLRFLEETFQLALNERARAVPHPPERLFTLYLQTLHSPLSDEDARAALRHALGEASAPTDPHPSLRERLEALGQPVRIPPTPAISAAKELLGPCHARLVETLDALWRKQLAPDWRRTFTETRARRRERSELEERLLRGEWLDGEERLRHASLVELFDGGAAARPYLEALRLHPEVGAEALFALGRIDLLRGDPDGIWRLENALQRLPERQEEGLLLLYEFHRVRGDGHAASEVRRRLDICPHPRPERFFAPLARFGLKYRHGTRLDA